MIQDKGKILILAITILLLILLVIFLWWPSIPREVQELGMYLTVGSHIGVNVDSDAIYFGTIPPGGAGRRGIIVKNDLSENRKITLHVTGDFADWIFVSENNFVLEPYGQKDIYVSVNVPKNADKRDYTGTFLMVSDPTKEPAPNVITGMYTATVDLNVLQGGKINLTVKDILGTLIPNATIFIWEPGPIFNDSGFTDANGEYLSDILAENQYLVEASKAGYVTGQEYVNVSNGSITQVTIVLSPAAAPILTVSPVLITETTTPGTQVEVLLTIGNIGDLNMTNITIQSGDSWISFNQTLISLMTPMTYTNVKVYLGAISTEGTYAGSIFVNSSNNGNKTIPVTFYVRAAPASPGPGGGGGGGGGSAGPHIQIIEYPKEINLSLGETASYLVIVKNPGLVTLNNVSLSLVGAPFDFIIEPQKIDKLSALRNASFLVSTSVPFDTVSGDYAVLFTAMSEEATSSEEAKLRVSKEIKADTKEDLIKEIEALRKIIKQLRVQSNWLDSNGGDVEDAVRFLDLAEGSLNFAEMYWKVGDVTNTIVQIEVARGYIKDAVLALALIDISKSRILLMGAILVVVMVFITLSALSFPKKHPATETKTNVRGIKKEIAAIQNEIVKLNDNYIKRKLSKKEYENEKQKCLRQIRALEEELVDKDLSKMGEKRGLLR
ncbi:MAG: carboxypeptidase regulatory-like domain-containing protein [archaeon]